MKFYKVLVPLVAYVAVVAQSCIVPDPRVGIGREPDNPARPLRPTHTGLSSYLATLVVESVPSGATIYLDDHAIGVTPMRIDNLQAGGHDVRLQLEGYKDYERLISLRERQVKPLRVKLTPLESKEDGRKSRVARGSVSKRP